jgi:hypothetical protein
MLLFVAPSVRGQSLAPRAYVITPVGSNAITITTNIYTGGIQFDNSVPITGSSGTITVIVPSYYRSLDFFGRSANITVAVPYDVGTFEGLVVNQQQSTYRSGLGDGAVRFSVNLKGGPAMKLPEFMKWKQKRLLGVSFITQFPSGQYDPTKLINIGINRWAFRPEVGYSEAWGKWLLDVYGAVWLFTTNPEFFSRNAYFPGTQQQTQEPIGAMETHLSHDFKLGTWVSLDGNFWYGGRTSLNGVANPNTLQRNSRIGATAAYRLSRHQSLKISFSNGALVRFGGDYKAFAVAWQYSWLSQQSRR